jgi:hypothetical protein
MHQRMPVAMDPSCVHAMTGTIPQSLQSEGRLTVTFLREPSLRVNLLWIPERNRTSGELEVCGANKSKLP